jgi:CheY-like chemotaxis protein
MLTDSDSQRANGRCILVVEDEYLIAAALQRQLEQLGVQVLGPVPTVAAALDLLANAPTVDAAILDVNVHGENVFPVADAVRKRGAPLVFATGYDQLALPERYADLPRCEKPVDVEQILRILFD